MSAAAFGLILILGAVGGGVVFVGVWIIDELAIYRQAVRRQEDQRQLQLHIQQRERDLYNARLIIWAECERGLAEFERKRRLLDRDKEWT